MLSDDDKLFKSIEDKAKAIRDAAKLAGPVSKKMVQEVTGLTDERLDKPIIGEKPEGRKTLEESVDPDKYARIQRNLARIKQNAQENNLDVAAVMDKYLEDIEGLESYLVEEAKGENYEPISMRTLTRDSFKGAARGIMALGLPVTLVADATETLLQQASAIMRFKFDEIPTMRFKATRMLTEGSEAISEAAGGIIGESPEDMDQRFISRAVEKTSEYVPPGALLVKGMTTMGARLATEAPEGLTMMRRVMVDMARDPKKAQILEGVLSGSAATSGEIAATIAGEEHEYQEWIRLAAELGSILPTTIAQNLSSKLYNIITKKITLGSAYSQHAADLQVGDLLNFIAEVDPNFVRNVEGGRRLVSQTGAELTFDQIAQNPELTRTIETLMVTQPGTASILMNRQQQATEGLNKFIDEVAPLVNRRDPITPERFQRELREFTTKKLDEIEQESNRLVRESVESLNPLRPSSTPEEIGETAMVHLEVRRSADMRKAEQLYDKLPNEKMYPVKWIEIGMERAKFSKLQREAIEAAAKSGREVPIPLEYSTVPKLIQELWDVNFAGKDTVSLLQIREFRRIINNEIASAQRAGDTDLVNRLIQIRGGRDQKGRLLRYGIDKQLDVIRLGERGQARTLLKEANDFYEGVRDVYDRSLASIMTQRRMSMNTFYPEDFSRMWIRPSDKKASVRVARDYVEAFGDSERAKSFIRDSAAGEIFKILDDAQSTTGINEGTFNRVQVWLNRHEQNLRAHGIWDDFNTVEKAIDAGRRGARMLPVNRQHFENVEFAQLIGLRDVDNIPAFIRSKLDAGRLGDVSAQVKRTKNKPAIRAFNRFAFDSILDSAKPVGIDNTEQLIRNPDKLLIVINQQEKQLVEALGRNHVESLRTIGRVWKRQFGQPTIRTKSQTAFADELGRQARFGQSQMGRVFSKIRASMQGFVSPEFTAIQLANQAFDIINANVAHNVLRDTILNPDKAAELMALARTESGRRMIRVIGVAAMPATASAIEENLSQ